MRRKPKLLQPLTTPKPPQTAPAQTFALLVVVEGLGFGHRGRTFFRGLLALAFFFGQAKRLIEFFGFAFIGFALFPLDLGLEGAGNENAAPAQDCIARRCAGEVGRWPGGRWVGGIGHLGLLDAGVGSGARGVLLVHR